MDCEMCGSKPAAFKADVEGGELNVCSGCSRFGRIIGRIMPEVKVKKKAKQQDKTVQAPQRELIQVIAEDYAKKIRNAREKLGMKHDDFAKFVSEKGSVIHKIETGAFEPSLKLARKLEKMLKIKLIEEHEEVPTTSKKAKGDVFTLGDVIKVKGR